MATFVPGRLVGMVPLPPNDERAELYALISFLVDQLGGGIVISAGELHRYREFGQLDMTRFNDPAQIRIVAGLRGQDD